MLSAHQTNVSENHNVSESHQCLAMKEPVSGQVGASCLSVVSVYQCCLVLGSVELAPEWIEGMNDCEYTVVYM